DGGDLYAQHVDSGGVLGPTVSVPPGGANAFALRLLSGNPARSRVSFDVSVPPGLPFELRVVDAQGRRVAVPADGVSSGPRTVVWRFATSGGERVAPGVYWAVLDAGSQRSTVRFVVLDHAR